MCGLQGPTKENTPLHLKQYAPPAHIKQTLHNQPGEKYAQITKQNSYAATNMGQDHHINQPHQQTNDICTRLKNMMDSLFEQMGTTLNILTAVLSKLK
jgi:hypothetical protein